MIHWADQIDIPKVSLLPLALIGVLVAYANWQRQKDAVKYGRLSIVAVAPFVAVLTVPIVNFPTFVIVLFCVVVASTVGVRHIPRRTRSDWARNFLYAGILCNAVMLLMLKTLGLDQTPTYVIWVFLGLFGAAISTSLILFVLDNMTGTLIFVGSVVLVALILMGLWWIITLFGLDESHPAIAEVIVYATLIVVTVLLIACLMMKSKVSMEAVDQHP